MDITDYKEKLRVNKHALDDALEDQAVLMAEISEIVADCNWKQHEAKNHLETIEAELLEKYRDREEKVTVAVIAGQVIRDSRRVNAWVHFQERRRECEKWQALQDAWRQRGFAIKTMADLYASNYYSPVSTTAPVQYERVREKMAQSRQSVSDDQPIRRRPS